MGARYSSPAGLCLLPRGLALAMLLVAGPLPSLALGQATGPDGFIDRITDSQDSAARPFTNLLESQREWTVYSLQEGPQPFTPEGADTASQSAVVADYDWLKASGYDFAKAPLQQQGIEVLKGFSTLPDDVLAANLDILARINKSAAQDAKRHAMVDAYDIPYLHFLAEALGPRLGAVFIQAYENGQLRKAAALIKATEVGTSAAKEYFNFPRPFSLDDSPVELVQDNWVLGDGHTYTAGGASFPSGHTNTGQTDALVLAQMLPERFAALVARGDGYGYSRVVLGVHYPLDVIGGRMHAEFAVAHYLNDFAYHRLFEQAKGELRTALERGCGVPLDECAAPGDESSDPWASAAARSFHEFTLNYDLPTPGPTDQSVRVPEGAEALLEGPLPNLSADQRRTLLESTAGTSGQALDSQTASWQRLDLIRAFEAAGSR